MAGAEDDAPDGGAVPPMTRADKLAWLGCHQMFPPAETATRAGAVTEDPAAVAPKVSPAPPLAVASQEDRLAVACQEYRRCFRVCRAMAVANPGHASLPALWDRLDRAREALFALLDGCEPGESEPGSLNRADEKGVISDHDA